jgi:hypothetical protein
MNRCFCELYTKWNDELGEDHAFIEYCSLHAAAPDLYEALGNLFAVVNANENWTETYKALDIAETVLAKAKTE